MMMYKETTKVIPLGDDREITISTGKLAKQADGAVVVKQGDTMLLATVVAAKDAKPDVDFMPLSVEYKGEIRRCRPLSGRLPEKGGTSVGQRNTHSEAHRQGPPSALSGGLPCGGFRDGESDFGGEGHSAGCARGPRRIGGARRIGYSLRRSHFGGARIAYRR